MNKCIKRLINKATHIYGYEIFKLNIENLTYGRVFPIATYSPWNKDEKFKEVYEVIKRNTLVDIYRCYELWCLVEQSKKLQGSLIEVGVWKGGTGILIAKRALSVGIVDPIFLCDTFKGVIKTSEKDNRYKGGEHADTSIKEVEHLIKKLNISNIKILEGVFPDDTGECIEKEKFRFCHIDVDTYYSARDIVDWIWDKMVIGGIIVYDDYGFESCRGITELVDEQRNYLNRLIIHNLNGHGITIKIA